MKRLFLLLSMVTFSLKAMEENKSLINLPLARRTAAVSFNQDEFDSRKLFNDHSVNSVVGFAEIESEYFMPIIKNTCPQLAELVQEFPQDPRLGIVRRYAQAVALRLSLLPAAVRNSHIEWARSAIPTDLREMDYIVEGKPSESVCGKAITIGCQRSLKKEFEALLQEYKSKLH